MDIGREASIEFADRGLRLHIIGHQPQVNVRTCRITVLIPSIWP